MDKIFKYITWLTIFLSFGLLITISYWLFIPVKTVEFKKQQLPVLNKEVKSGDYVTYEVEYCKYTKIIPIVSANFKDTIEYPFTDVPSFTNPTGCYTNTVRRYIPKAIYPSKGYIELVFKYKVNPVREETVTVRTEDFIIID